jgi:hypothetical protein
MKLVNYMLDIAFTIETPIQDFLDIPPAQLIEAMQRRVDYLRNNPHELADAVGFCDSYETEKEMTI